MNAKPIHGLAILFRPLVLHCALTNGPELTTGAQEQHLKKLKAQNSTSETQLNNSLQQ
jgi:hypothetical protein